MVLIQQLVLAAGKDVIAKAVGSVICSSKCAVKQVGAGQAISFFRYRFDKSRRH